MDLKTKLSEEEIIFLKKPQGTVTINSLNKKGIFTVEDFINSDIDQIASDSLRRKQFRAFKEILKYKYLGTPLVIDIILEKEYNDLSLIIGGQLRHDTMTLGFGDYNFAALAKQILATKGSCKMIDIIQNMHEKHNYLKDFYMEYYNTKIKNETMETIVESDKNSLDLLKNELVSLLNQRNELDAKISSLLVQINSLEGGKIVNGRK